MVRRPHFSNPCPNRDAISIKEFEAIQPKSFSRLRRTAAVKIALNSSCLRCTGEKLTSANPVFYKDGPSWYWWVARITRLLARAYIRARRPMSAAVWAGQTGTDWWTARLNRISSPLRADAETLRAAKPSRKFKLSSPTIHALYFYQHK